MKTTLQYRPGAAVRTTLDLRLQQAAERALVYGIQRARDSNCYGCWDANGGAIVALDPHDGSVRALASAPTYSPGVYSGRVTTRALAKQGLTPATAKAKNYPALNPRARRGLSARVDLQAGHGDRRDAAASRVALHATRVHGLVHVAARPCAPGLQELGSVRQPVDRPADGARALVRHVLLPTRRRVLRAPGERGPPPAGLGRQLRLRPRTGIDVGPEYRRSPPDPRVAAEALQLGARQTLEAGRLDPARDRPEGSAGHPDEWRASTRWSRTAASS